MALGIAGQCSLWRNILDPLSVIYPHLFFPPGKNRLSWASRFQIAIFKITNDLQDSSQSTASTKRRTALTDSYVVEWRFTHSFSLSANLVYETNEDVTRAGACSVRRRLIAVQFPSCCPSNYRNDGAADRRPVFISNPFVN